MNNVEEYRSIIFELNGVEPFNKEMTFYYDESGNCRKFALTEIGFNDTCALKSDFVLAGVAHEGKSFDIDVQALYSALDYKEGQKELKIKHLYHNSTDFLSFISSKRTTLFLEWLINSKLYIHYCAFNNLYYSLADIVDSLWETHPQCIKYVWEIKSALYDFAIEHQDEVTDIFIRHTYPDIKDASTFCNELCNLINIYNYDDAFDSGFFLELFRQMLKTAGNQKKVVFLQDNEPFILIEEYYMLYFNRCTIFSKSTHIFDEEPNVRKKLADFQLYEDGVPLNNWRFVESHKNIFVQISDLIAGLLRKLFMFLDENSMEKILSIALNLNEKQGQNFSILWSLINRSDNVSKLLIMNTNTPKNVNDRTMKLRLLQMLGTANRAAEEGGVNR